MNSEVSKVKEIEKLIKQVYESYSVLPSLVTLQDYSVSNPEKLLKFAIRVGVEHEWFTDPTIVPNVVFYDGARSIALSERAYLVKKMRDLPGAIKRSGIKPEVLESVVEEMKAAKLTPTAVLLPIDMYQEVNLKWSRRDIRIDYGKQNMILKGTEMRLLWSNKYNPFEECFLVSRKFANWFVKPSAKNRLKVIFEKCGSQITGVLMQTLFYFQPVKESGVAVIKQESIDTVQGDAPPAK